MYVELCSIDSMELSLVSSCKQLLFLPLTFKPWQFSLLYAFTRARINTSVSTMQLVSPRSLNHRHHHFPSVISE
jgi:hypothetical protein